MHQNAFAVRLHRTRCRSLQHPEPLNWVKRRKKEGDRKGEVEKKGREKTGGKEGGRINPHREIMSTLLGQLYSEVPQRDKS